MTDAPSPRRLHILYAKRPDPGRAKTRLGAGLGMERAARFYANLLDLLVDRFDGARGRGVELHLHVDPPDAVAWFEERWPALRGRVRAQAQVADLGDRMAASFAMAFAEGFERAALTCSDCPELLPSDIDDALDALDRADASFGPATDGGYYLVAWKRPLPALFAGMAWSRPDVMEQTRRRAAAAKLALAETRPLLDCDTAEDLARLPAELRAKLLPEA